MSAVCATNYYICIRWWIIWWSLLQTRFDDDLCYKLLQTTNFRCFSCYMMIFATNYYICIRWWIINYLLGNVWRWEGILYVRLLWRWARSVRQASLGRRSVLQHQAPRDLRYWNGTQRRQVFFVIFCMTSLLLQRVISVFYNSTSLSHTMQDAMSWRRWVLKIMKEWRQR